MGYPISTGFQGPNAAPHKYSMKDVSKYIGEIGHLGSTLFICSPTSIWPPDSGRWCCTFNHDPTQPSLYRASTNGSVCRKKLWVHLHHSRGWWRLVVRGIANMIVYIDDLLLHSEDHPTHLKLLDEALGHLIASRIKMNLKNVFLEAREYPTLASNWPKKESNRAQTNSRR